MRAEWRKLAAGTEDIAIDRLRSAVDVAFANGRRHVVRIAEDDDSYELEAVIAGPRETAQLHDPHMTAWRRNRSSRVVGYRVDARGRLCAHAWTPREGLTREMFLFLVRTLAREADRHELLLTGADRK
jgi:hypothetical protein